MYARPVCLCWLPIHLFPTRCLCAEVEIIQWFVKVGDQIKAFDRVCEVQSDKATVEISSRYDGEVVKVHTEQGGIALVGKPLIDLRPPTAAGSSAAPAPPSAAGAT